MGLISKWNEYMGPKDERLEAEEGRSTKASAYILLAGALISLYYAIMLDQVASATEHTLLTPLGQSVVPVQFPLLLTIFVAGVVSVMMQVRSGFFTSRTRYAQVDRIPWEYVVLCAAACGAAVAVLTCGMRILAEVQIVGLAEVAWLGDLAIGIVFFAIAFGLGLACFALVFHDAIKRRQQMERELEG